MIWVTNIAPLETYLKDDPKIETYCYFKNFYFDEIIEYKGKKWDIYNEFFWMLKDEIHQLANNNNLSFTYNDV